MASAQSFIRAEVSRGASPGPKGTEAFPAYAIAISNELIPEMENAARLTLDQPMTFQSLGEGLPLFEGWALHDLLDYRRRCRDNLVTCLNSFPLPSNWVGCPEVMPDPGQDPVPPTWLNKLFLRHLNDLKLQEVTRPLDVHLRILPEYFTALKNHETCHFCLRAHMRMGIEFQRDLKGKLEQARNKVTYFTFQVPRDLLLVGTLSSRLFPWFYSPKS